MWFKLAFGISFLFAVTVAAKTARRHGGTLNHLSHEVRGLLFLRAALGIVFHTALAAWMFRAHSATWMYLPIPMALRWTAVGLLLPTLAFFAASFHALGANYRGGVGLYPAHTLVTSGPYHYIRHPIYVAFIGIMGLVLLLSANWVLGLSGLLLVASIAVARIPIEERQLHAHFGTAWEAYCTRTGSIVPRIGRQ